MRIISIWLLVLGVCAGFQVRAFGVDPCDILTALHLHEHGDHDHHHEDGNLPDSPCDSSHDQQCPLDHHHHGMCKNCMPMNAEINHAEQVSFIHSSLVPIRSDAARVPDAPFEDLDKPPLI